MFCLTPRFDEDDDEEVSVADLFEDHASGRGSAAASIVSFDASDRGF